MAVILSSELLLVYHIDRHLKKCIGISSSWKKTYTNEWRASRGFCEWPKSYMKQDKTRVILIIASSDIIIGPQCFHRLVIKNQVREALLVLLLFPLIKKFGRSMRIMSSNLKLYGSNSWFIYNSFHLPGSKSTIRTYFVKFLTHHIRAKPIGYWIQMNSCTYNSKILDSDEFIYITLYMSLIEA